MSEKKFWKKIRNNRFYLALTGIICAILLFFLVLYLAVPSYSFAEIEPFNGEFVYTSSMTMRGSRASRACTALRIPTA